MIEQKELPRLVLSGLVIAYFGFALFSHWSEGLEETLKNVVMIVFGYWLGSSKGSTDKSAQLEQQLTGPQDVTVTNPPGNPVNVDQQP